MNIEVNKQTFEKLFNNSDFTDTDSEELYNKAYYYNKELEQGGFVIENYISNTSQFYLTDINA